MLIQREKVEGCSIDNVDGGKLAVRLVGLMGRISTAGTARAGLVGAIIRRQTNAVVGMSVDEGIYPSPASVHSRAEGCTSTDDQQ